MLFNFAHCTTEVTTSQIGVYMNSFHSAIQQATSNGLHPELCDLWRIYHPTSLMSDCEYQLSVPNILSFRKFGILGGSEMRRNDELKNRRNDQKSLYVPVTRKVILTDEKNHSYLALKVSSVIRNN